MPRRIRRQGTTPLHRTTRVSHFPTDRFINMASTLNLAPTKGMTLPFISYGGSSLISLAFGFGIILSLTRRHPTQGGLE